MTATTGLSNNASPTTDACPLCSAPGRLSEDPVRLLTDITSQRKLGDILSRHRRLAALGEMAATLAHQIRTPLSAAILYAGNAAHSATTPERREELLGRAVDCLHDLEQLVDDMLRFARGAGRPDAVLDLREVLGAVDTAARPLLGKQQVLDIDAIRPDLVVTGHREALAGALINLVANALAAAGPSARVAIRVRTRPGTVDIAVSDNGPGVPVSLRERIFEPFYTSRSDGTGLGLAVVRSVAEAHGGSVRVDENVVPGACFVVSLPLATGATAPTRERAA